MSNNEEVSLNSYLWCGSSIWCLCNHHLSNHYTTTEGVVCKFPINRGSCKCTEFRPFRKVKLRASNRIDVLEYEKVMETDNKQ